MSNRYKAKEELIALIKALATKDYEESLIVEAENNYKHEEEGEAELHIADWESKDSRVYTIALTERYFEERDVHPMEYGKWYNLKDLTVDQIEDFVRDAGFCFYHNVLWTRGEFEPKEREIKGGGKGNEGVKIGCLTIEGTLVKNHLGEVIGTAGEEPEQIYNQIWIKAME